MQESNNQTSLFTELVNNMPHSLLVANRDGQLTFCNKIIEPTFGGSIQKVLNKSWIDKFEIYKVDKSYQYTIEDMPIARAIRGEMLVGEKMRIKSLVNNDEVYTRMCAYPIELES